MTSLSNSKTALLGDLSESINTGLDAIRRAPIVDYPTEIRCLRIQDISQGKPLQSWGYTNVNERDFEKYRLRPGEIIMARTCSTGINFLVKQELSAVFNNGLARIRVDRALVDPKYLFYVFGSRHFKTYIDGISGGTSVQLNMKVGDLAKYKVPLPPMPKQKAIAHILGTLDDKIELNRKMNETLEEMARAIFKSWFVDFDPVRAKMNGKQPYGMDAETAALFPSEFEDSKLGKIPQGWEVSCIDDEVSVFGGGTPSTKKKEYWEDGDNFWITPRDLSSNNTLVVNSTSRKITKEGVASISSGQLPVGTLLLSSRAPIGYLAISTVPISVNQGFIAMVCDKRISNLFTYFWTLVNLDEIKSRASGTTFAEISKKNFKPIKIVLPGQMPLKKFDEMTRPMLDKITNNTKESKTLTELRDTLLPKLLSGELRVSGAEKLIEEAA